MQGHVNAVTALTNLVEHDTVRQRLARLIGSARARILLALTEPRTTTRVARELGIAASTASAHLTALADADLVTRKRRGREVLYQLTERGRQLLLLLAAE